MLTMAIPDVKILAVHLFSIYDFNVFARWNRRTWFKRWEVCGDGVSVWWQQLCF